MQKSASLLASVLLASGALGLSPTFREWKESRPADDRFNDEWLDKFFDYAMSLDDYETFDSPVNYEGDEDRTPETDVMEMTHEKYLEIFHGEGPKPTVPWYICFLVKNRTQSHFNHSSHAVNSMRFLADQYEGKVRFAYVDSHKASNEFLKESYYLVTLPNAFLITPEEGKVYEHYVLSTNIRQMEDFLEGYKEGTNVFQTFDMPHIFNKYTIYGRYIHKYIWNAWFPRPGGWKDTIAIALFYKKIYNDTAIFDVFPSFKAQWETKMDIYLQCRLVIYTLIASALLALYIVYKLMCCICCPASKTAAKVKTN